MVEKAKEFYENHAYGAQIGGTIVGYVVGMLLMMKWAAKITAKAIALGIDNSVLGRK